MPVVFRRDRLRYYFFSNEGRPPEPAHIHVKGGGKDAKIWLVPEITIADAMGSIGASFPLYCRLSPKTTT